MIDHAAQYLILKYLRTYDLFISQVESESIHAGDLQSMLALSPVKATAYDLFEADLIEPSPSITVTDKAGTPVFWKLTDKADRVLNGGPLTRRAKWI